MGFAQLQGLKTIIRAGHLTFIL